MTTVAVRRSTPRSASAASSASISTKPERRLGLRAAPVQRHRGYDGRGELVLDQQVADLGAVAVGDDDVDVLLEQVGDRGHRDRRRRAIWSSGRARPSAFVMALPPSASRTLMPRT